MTLIKLNLKDRQIKRRRKANSSAYKLTGSCYAAIFLGTLKKKEKNNIDAQASLKFFVLFKLRQICKETIKDG
jgi:hypothetical protein